jgi:hypothetical protein
VLHGMSRDDVEHHWFTCEAIWYFKRVIYEVSKISQLDTNFIDISSTSYMKYKVSMPKGQHRSLKEIKRDLLREFQNPNS